MIYYYNDNKKVVIIGHSMGNPVMNYFYHTYVDSVVIFNIIHAVTKITI